MLLLCFTASHLGTVAHAQTLKNIKIGYPALCFRHSNVWVAREMGLIDKDGMED
jgi:hypothetical protein